MAKDYLPLTDWRASGDYRMLASQNLLQRFYLETTTTEPVQVAPVQMGLRAAPGRVVGEADRS